jgi:hypothetical protein
MAESWGVKTSQNFDIKVYLVLESVEIDCLGLWMSHSLSSQFKKKFK